MESNGVMASVEMLPTKVSLQVRLLGWTASSCLFSDTYSPSQIYVPACYSQKLVIVIRSLMQRVTLTPSRTHV